MLNKLGGGGPDQAPIDPNVEPQSKGFTMTDADKITETRRHLGPPAARCHGELSVRDVRRRAGGSRGRRGRPSPLILLASSEGCCPAVRGGGAGVGCGVWEGLSGSLRGSHGSPRCRRLTGRPFFFGFESGHLCGRVADGRSCGGGWRGKKN